MEQIAEWLGKLGMSEYAERFAENRIDFAVLPDLTDQDLKDIGVVLGDRRKILRAIARLDAAPEDVVLEPKSPVNLSFIAGQVLPIEAMSREQGDVTPEEVDPDAGGGPQRANYYRLVTRAVKGFESTAEARQVIYERARKALITHLRFNQPGLSKTAIVKERWSSGISPSGESTILPKLTRADFRSRLRVSDRSALADIRSTTCWSVAEAAVAAVFGSFDLQGQRRTGPDSNGQRRLFGSSTIVHMGH